MPVISGSIGSLLRTSGFPLSASFDSGSEYTLSLLNGPGYLTLESKRDSNGFYTSSANLATVSASNMVDRSLVKSDFIASAYLGYTTTGSLIFIPAKDLSEEELLVKVVSNNLISFVDVPTLVVEPRFIFSIQTDNTGTSNNDQFTLPLTTSTDLNITVDWGDGNIDTITSHTAPEITHTYASAGEYTIKIDGTLRGFKFDNGGDRLKIKDVSNWGVMQFDVDRTFRGCTNLTCSATDAVIVIGTSIVNAFLNCRNFNGAIGNWDISNVSNVEAMFQNCNNFNQDLSQWDVSNITRFSKLFRQMSFNQDISGWDVSSALDMPLMFANNSQFNQDIGGWDVSNVTNMSSMFSGATAFDQNIGSWDIANVTNFTNFMLGITLSTANYDALLIGWEAQAVQNNINIDFGNSQYSSGAAATARQALIDDHNWVIQDGGQV